MIIYTEKKNSTVILLEYGLTLLVNALVLMMATKIFNGFEVSSYLYAILAAFIILVLNKTIKPVIGLLTLPLTVLTLGLFYPFINVFILKLTSLMLGSHFVVEGWLVPFFISIFISVMTIILDVLITKRIMGGIR